MSLEYLGYLLATTNKGGKRDDDGNEEGKDTGSKRDGDGD